MIEDRNSLSPTERFSSRVDDYARYRPHYPAAIVETLAAELGLLEEHVVADVGSGTGISSSIFLANGNQVFGIEPNAGMRGAAEAALGGETRFVSVDGRAEATTLPDACVDLVIAGQAFHWFDPGPTRAEVARILRPPGRFALFWNTRIADATPVMRAYETLLQQYGREYAQVRHDRTTAEDVAIMFSDRRFAYRAIANEQTLDLAGLAGRTFSSSYMPRADDPEAPALLDSLSALFERFERGGAIRFDYRTELYFGLIERP